MRLFYHSAAPWVHTGYGRVTEEVAPRLHNRGHEVAIQCLSAVREAPLQWHGDNLEYELDSPITIYPSEGGGSRHKFGLTNVEDHFEDFNGDLYHTHFDTWMEVGRKLIPQFGIPYSSYIIVDHFPVPNAVLEQINNAHRVVTMSRYASQQLERKGIPSTYIPHGVDSDKYYPYDEDERDDMEVQSRGPEGNIRNIRVGDRFIVGIVAANHGDRKNIPHQMTAFNRFRKEVDDEAILYIHTDMNSPNGYNLIDIKDRIGIPDENLIFTRGDDYGSVGDEYLNGLYNAFDVLLNCSMGESWGLTVTEAQAAGTPVIATNFSSMPEQQGSLLQGGKEKQCFEYEDPQSSPSYVVQPHGISVNTRMPIWREKVSSLQFMVHPDDIFTALKRYYYEPDMRKTHGNKAREFVKDNYSWENNVVPAFDDLFTSLEGVITQ